MKPYHKIQTVFLRDPATKHKTLLKGVWAKEEFSYLCANRWIFTEKVDGTNIRVQFRDSTVSFAGRTDRAQTPPNLLAALQEMFPAEKLRSVMEGDFCLYGEGYGGKIQKAGKLYRPDPSFVLFDVRVGDLWLHRYSVEDIAEKLEIQVVPKVGEGTLYAMLHKVKEGFASAWGEFKAEGIIAFPETPLLTRTGERVITKIKYKDFRRS